MSTVSWWAEANQFQRVVLVATVAVVAVGVVIAIIVASSAEPSGAAPEVDGEDTPAATSSVAPAPVPEVSADDEEQEDPAVEPTEAADEHAGHEDAAGDDHSSGSEAMREADPKEAQQAHEAGVAAVMAVATQRYDESAQERAERLAPLFAEDSPTPTADPPLSLGQEVTRLLAEPLDQVNWVETYDPGEGRFGLLVSVRVEAQLIRADGTPGQDQSNQQWRVALVRDGGAWRPQVVFPANEPDPTVE